MPKVNSTLSHYNGEIKVFYLLEIKSVFCNFLFYEETVAMGYRVEYQQPARTIGIIRKEFFMTTALSGA